MTIDHASGRSRSLVLLAPCDAPLSGSFQRVSHNYSLYQSFQKEMQKLRGRVYRDDGAIPASALTQDQRHVLPTDDQSWHLLTIAHDGSVAGCTRYRQYHNSTNYGQLGVTKAALADCPTWGQPLRNSVEAELRRARLQGFSYVEVGGWAMDPAIRCTAECLRSVLATYAWSRLVGGALGLSTATERNGSASILHRLGGSPLEWNGASLPAYFDPHYNCRMHMLRFDSRRPNPRYESAVEQLRELLSNVLVISAERPMMHSFTPSRVPLPGSAAFSGPAIACAA